MSVDDGSVAQWLKVVMDKQIVVHSIDHASYALQLISVVSKPTYSYCEAYREGISWVESVATSKL